jgi:WXG100 family type VII secretion target
MATINAGANPDELDQLAARFSTEAGTVGSIQRSLNGQIMAAPWQGGTADRFRQRWNGEHRRAMAEAISFLNSNADVLRRNAQEQRNASSAAGAEPGPVQQVDTSRAVGGDPAASSSKLDGGQITTLLADIAEISTLVPTAAGFGAGIGLGLMDLFLDRDGYGGEYHAVEATFDVLGVAAAGVGLAGLVAIGLAGGAVAAPAAVVVVGGAMIAGGLIKGVDMFLDTGVGKRTMHGISDVGRDAWRSSARAMESAWDLVF